MWGVLRETEGERGGRTLAWVLFVPVLFLLNVFPLAFFSVGVWVLLKRCFFVYVDSRVRIWNVGKISCSFYCRVFPYACMIVFSISTEPSMHNETTTIGLCTDTHLLGDSAFIA